MENSFKIAVIGEPNKGKSSLVSTLAYDDNIKISQKSGETTISSKSSLKILDETIYELYDTPGFDNYTKLLDFYYDNKDVYSDFDVLVNEFINKFNNDIELEKDIEIYKVLLLKPLVLYVINSSESYNSGYEDELELLSLFKLPTFAIYNKKTEENYKHTWEGIVNKYFIASYDYDVINTTFKDKTQLLNKLKESINNKEIKEQLKKTISILEKDFHRRKENTFSDLVEYFYKIIHYKKEFSNLRSKISEKTFEKEYYNDLKNIESKFFRIVEEEWGFNNLEKEIKDLKNTKIDSKEFTKIFGLSNKSIYTISTLLGASAGATVGLGIDTSTLFGSMGTGTFIGTTIGGCGGLLTSIISTNYFEKKTMGFGVKKKVVYGPIKDFNWHLSLLSKLFTFSVLIISRSHANRKSLKLEENSADNIFRDKNKEISKLSKEKTEENIEKLKEILSEIYDSRNINE